METVNIKYNYSTAGDKRQSKPIHKMLNWYDLQNIKENVIPAIKRSACKIWNSLGFSVWEVKYDLMKSYIIDTTEDGDIICAIDCEVIKIK